MTTLPLVNMANIQIYIHSVWQIFPEGTGKTKKTHEKKIHERRNTQGGNSSTDVHRKCIKISDSFIAFGISINLWEFRYNLNGFIKATNLGHNFKIFCE